MKPVTLVLSGGGVRGLAHIGVIKVLEEEGIPLKRVVGCSIGALVGAMYASAMDAEKVGAFARSVRFHRLLDFGFSKKGLVKGRKLEKALRGFIAAETFEELQLPLAVVATKMRTGEPLLLKNGPLFPALLASCALPGVFSPQVVDGVELIDGGMSMPVPIVTVPSKDPIIISDVSVNLSLLKDKPNMLEVLRQSVYILQKQLIEHELQRIKRPHVLLRPDVHEWDFLTFRNDPLLITRGEQATREALPRIKKLLF
jgi:NTE family protein